MAISKTKKAKIKMSQLNCCWYCGRCNPNTIDHVKPASKGGDDSLENLVLACKSCNSSKKDLSIEQYRFHCSWLKTKYSKIISPIDAKRLMSRGVEFSDFRGDHVFWFEGGA